MDLTYETKKELGPQSAKKAPPVVPKPFVYEKHEKCQQNAPQARYSGSEAIKYFTGYGVPVKDFYARGADSDKATYSTETPIEKGKRYKVCLIDRFFCLDIDRKPADLAKEGHAGDGLSNLYYWLESIGKTGALLPDAFLDIEQGSFPCYMRSPGGGLHLYFRYAGRSLSGLLCAHVEIKTVQISAGYKDGKPYVFYGDLDKAPKVPYFILDRVQQNSALEGGVGEPTLAPPQGGNYAVLRGGNYSWYPNKTAAGQKAPQKRYRKEGWEKKRDWDKILEGAQKSWYAAAGRDNLAHVLTRFAKADGYSEDEILGKALAMEWNFDRSFTETQLLRCIRNTYARV